MRLYVPGTVLQEGSNDLVLLEMDSVPSQLTGATAVGTSNKTQSMVLLHLSMVQRNWSTSQTSMGLLAVWTRHDADCNRIRVCNQYKCIGDVQHVDRLQPENTHERCLPNPSATPRTTRAAVARLGSGKYV